LKKTPFILSLSILCGSFSYCQTWDSVGTGVNSEVNALAVYNGEIYAGGNFDTAGGINSKYIARWDGTAWDSVNGGANAGTYDIMVSAITVFNANLYAGGAYNVASGWDWYNLAQWNGTVWNSSILGISSNINTLAVYNGNLYAGGYFYPLAPNNNLAELTNSGLDTLTSGIQGNDSYVSALCVYNGKLYVGGSFNNAGGISANNIACWNGTKWDSLNAGISGNVYALAVYKGALYAGGAFDSAGGKPAINIAKWDGSNWSSVGGTSYCFNCGISALDSSFGYLYAGGSFDSIGGIPANDIAFYDGTKWYNMNQGINGQVNALYPYNGDMYAGGIFDSAGGKPAHNIALWSSPAGINELKVESEKLKVYPNPSNGKFTIQMANSHQLIANSQVHVYNVLGEQVFSQYSIPIAIGTNTHYTMDLSGQPSGIYFYRVVKEDGTLAGSGKVVIDK
jgi:hypothetical protein